MSHGLYAKTQDLADDLTAAGYTAWSDQLIGVLRGGATGSEIVMGIRWVLSRMADAGTLEDESLMVRARHLADEATLMLAR